MKPFSEIIESDRVEKVNQIKEVLDQINERGINHILCAVAVTQDNEEYDIHTSQERLDELKRLNEEKRELEQKKFKEENRKAAGIAYQAMIDAQAEHIANLVGHEKTFYEKIMKTRRTVPNRYSISSTDLVFLYELYLKDDFEFGMMCFYAGMESGMRYMKNQSRRKG